MFYIKISLNAKQTKLPNIQHRLQYCVHTWIYIVDKETAGFLHWFCQSMEWECYRESGRLPYQWRGNVYVKLALTLIHLDIYTLAGTAPILSHWF